jgi:Leucine-rich repeat (LRR) protein
MEIKFDVRSDADLKNIPLDVTHLNVSNNKLTSLDVSNLKNLTHLNVSHNKLTSLDVSGLKNLTCISDRKM